MGEGQCEPPSLDMVQVVFSVAIFDDNVHDCVIFFLSACISSMTPILLPVIPDRLDK